MSCKLGDMSRWVKVSLIVAGLLIALFVGLSLAGLGGDHGPGRHLSPGREAPSSDTGEHSPPEGHGP